MPNRWQALDPFTWSRWRFLCTVTGLALALMVANAWFIFDRIPHLIDAATYLFQARSYAQGLYIAPAPPLPEFFGAGNTVITPTEWFSVYPPGYSLLLVPGVWLGFPWLLDPLLGAMTVVLIYATGRELYGEAVGRTAAILALVSPFFIWMTGTFMRHTSAACCFAFGLWGTVHLLRGSERWRHAWAVALGFGWMAITRPYTALLLAAPCLLSLLVATLRGRVRWAHAWLMLGVLVFFSGVFMAHQYAIRERGNEVYLVSYMDMSFLGFREPGHPRGFPYSPSDAVRKFVKETRTVNRDLFGNPGLGLVPLVLAMLWLPRSRHWGDALLTACAWALPVGFFFFWWTDDYYGARYQFEAIPAYLLLTARGLHLIGHAIRRRWRWGRRSFVRGALGAQVCCAALFTFPHYAHRFAGDYVGPQDYLRSYVKDLDRALIFLESNCHMCMGDWTLAYNDAALTGPVLLAYNHWYKNDDLARRFPGYETYRYTLYFEIDWSRNRGTPVYQSFEKIDTHAELQAHLAAQDRAPPP